MEANNMKNKMLKSGGIALISGGILFFILEFITSLFWTNSTYNYLRNYVSDLGVPVPSMTNGQSFVSPMYGLMNFNFVLLASLILIGSIFFYFSLNIKRKNTYLVLTILTSLGLLMIASFPGYKWLGIAGHQIGAMLTLFSAAINAIITSSQIGRKFNSRLYQVVTIILGIIALIGIIITLVQNYPASITGLIERIAIYPVILMQIVTGSLMLYIAYR